MVTTTEEGMGCAKSDYLGNHTFKSPVTREDTIQNAIEAHKNRPFRWETQISPVPTYGIPGHSLGHS